MIDCQYFNEVFYGIILIVFVLYFVTLAITSICNFNFFKKTHLFKQFYRKTILFDIKL